MYFYRLQGGEIMSSRRIKAILLHAWYHLNHSVETWIDLFWFSLINIFVFGLITIYFVQEGNTQQVAYILQGLILWGVIYTGQYSITVGALWEIWSKSFSSLFISPLTLDEFVIGHMLGGLFKSIAVFLITAGVSLALYNYSIFQLGWILILFYFELLIFAWSAGIFILSLILRFGTNIQSLAWGLVFLVQPISAVFFPVDVLPQQIRWLSYAFPVTYIFEAARSKISTGLINWQYIAYATLLNIVFFFLCYLLMKKMMQRGRETGSFARMEN